MIDSSDTKISRKTTHHQVLIQIAKEPRQVLDGTSASLPLNFMLEKERKERVRERRALSMQQLQQLHPAWLKPIQCGDRQKYSSSRSDSLIQYSLQSSFSCCLNNQTREHTDVKTLTLSYSSCPILGAWRVFPHPSPFCTFRPLAFFLYVCVLSKTVDPFK